MIERNHEIEKIYMDQLRNIETSIYFMSSKRTACKKKSEQLKRPYKKLTDPNPPASFKDYINPDFGFAIAGLIVGLIFIGLVESFLNFHFPGVSAIAIVSIIILVCAMLVTASDKYEEAQNKYNQIVSSNKKKNEQNAEKHKKNLVIAQDYEKIADSFDQSIAIAKNIRTELYNINWIPGKYRDIRVIYYIHNIVTTAEISIEEALKYFLLEEINSKLDTVLSKLDKVIANQEEMILNEAILMSQNQEIINQNKKTIAHISQIETNSALTRDYAQIGAQYAEANAYFSAASYFELSSKKIQ